MMRENGAENEHPQECPRAKEYLVGRIAEKAKLEGAPLTEVERKMLYFSETGWTIPDIVEVNAGFERDYNDVEYEEKIGGIVRRIQEKQNLEDEEQRGAWCAAVETVGEEDCYLLTLIDIGCRAEGKKLSRLGRIEPWLPDLGNSGARPSGDVARLILVSIGVSAALFTAMMIWASVRR
ncbi:MAG: hypothetical protein ABR923_02055 [Terracidiphilus sp.]|jgi:hypothetical protein